MAMVGGADAAGESWSELKVGQYFLVWYSDDDVWHERCGQAAPRDTVTLAASAHGPQHAPRRRVSCAGQQGVSHGLHARGPQRGL